MAKESINSMSTLLSQPFATRSFEKTRETKASIENQKPKWAARNIIVILIPNIIDSMSG